MGIFFPTRKVRRTNVDTTFTYRIFRGAPVTVSGSSSRNAGVEEILTWSHKKGRNGDYGEGGPFWLYRDRWYHPDVQYHRAFTNLAGYSFYQGPLWLSRPTWWSEGTPIGDPGYASLSSDGATAVARVLPTNPSFDLSTFIGEGVKDGVPRVPGIELLRSRSKDLLGSSGSEYLNVQFGWLPLVSDLKDFARTVKNVHGILDNYRKGSDKRIRRRYAFPEDVQIVTGTGNFPVSPVQSGVSGTGSATLTQTTRRWFEGAFRYHIPMGDSGWDRFSRFNSYANKLLGVRLTPDTVWNLTPWSWAIDWFTNAGDVIHNISALGSDGLVMQYGYSMRHTQQRNDYVCHPIYPKGAQSGGAPELTASHVREYKQRVAANPYGFGLTDSALTSRQLSILAALGLARTGDHRRFTSSDHW